MKKKLLSLLLIGLLFSTGAAAFSPFVIKDIRIEGIQRTEAGTVFSYLPVKVGDQLTETRASEAIKVLFATGFFRDVRVEAENGVMVIIVEERPAIAAINFVGLKEFDKDVILKALKEVGIANGRIFDRSQLDKAEQELKRQYLSKGKYGVQIVTTVTPQERNRVGINFNITEGGVAKIRQINVVGNQAFSEEELLDLFELRTPGWMTWYSKNDQYSRQKLSADLEKVKSFYMNQGYLDFNIDSTQVSISPDKQDVFISISLTEGERFQVSSVKVTGEFPIEEKELEGLVSIKAGDVFSRDKLNASNKAISDYLSKSGYAFSNVNAVPEVYKEKRRVALTIFIDPSKRVYVRRINITGNTRTRDEVIRREFRQMEGGWFDSEKLATSKQRVDRLAYFTESTIETPPVEGANDQIDININVTERPTGNLALGVGTSNVDKVILSASLSQDNFLGSGNSVSFEVNSARSYSTYALSYTNPYWTIDGISQGFDVYHRTTDTSKTAIANYKSASTGGGLRFGFPISEKQSIHLGVGVDQTSITTFNDSPPYYKDFVRDFGKTNLTIPITASWVSDSKDSFYFPTKGGYQRLGFEVGAPGGDLKYYQTTYQLQRFFPLSKKFTLMLNGELGYADGYGGKALPFYKNFYAGGVGSVRGYRTSSLGPISFDQNGNVYRIGGNAKVVGNAELLWSFPGLENTVRVGWFVDAGQVFTKDNPFKAADLRYSTGVSVAWVSPIGPLKVSFGKPLNKKIGDESEVFQFQLGSIF